MNQENNIPSIAVLLTCFNRKGKTLRCLNNLFEQKGLNEKYTIKVFLVDDGSTDGTSLLVQEKFPRVSLIKGNGHLYWNRGMHLAWKTAVEKQQYSYYLWLNDDTTLLSGAIDEMLACMILQGKPAVVCGAICSEVSRKFTYGGRTKESVEIEPKEEIQYCNTINGNCVLVSNEVFKTIGNLDPVFPHSIGDHDYGLRAIKAGFSVITTRIYVGYCERNVKLPHWCYREVPIKKRMRSLYSPLGNSHPYYFFIFENRHFGWPQAVKHYLSIHLRALIPSLWK